MRHRPSGAGFLALLCLVACQTQQAPTPGPTTKPSGGTLRVAVAALPHSTDPALTPAFESGVARVAFEALLKPQPDLSDVRPAAAAGYLVSADGLTYTFRLQPGGSWSDGVPVRARDFVLAWRRILDPRVNSPVADLFASRIENAGAYANLDPHKDASRIPAFLDGLGFRAVDDLTFQVQLDHPAPEFKWIATIPAGAPARADAPTSEPGPGNGPYHLQSVGKAQWSLSANLHYWAGRPRPGQILLVLQADATTDLGRYLAGSEDLTSAAGDEAAQLAADPGLVQELVREPRLEEAWMQFNVHRAPFDNPGVRLAFARAVDRDALVRDVLKGAGLPSVGPIPEGLRGYRPALTAQRFDAAGARATLAGSGVGGAANGIHLLVRDLPFDRRLAEFFAGQVRDHLGIQLTIDIKPSPEVTRLLVSGDFSVQGPGGWIADYPDEQSFLDGFRTEDFSQWSRYSSSGYDHLVAQADADADLTSRLREYLQAQQLLAGDAPVAFLYQAVSWNLKQPWVEGATYTPLDDWPGDVYAAGLAVAPR